ncbi:MAG: MogA/MoaB family molybdenum cofactor biosynthesis protein [Thermoleophilia bacterium]
MTGPMKPFMAAVVTVSDSCSRGERIDESGSILGDLLAEAGAVTPVERRLVSDERREIAAMLDELCTGPDAVDLVITTGGTGLSPRDVTPEATLDIIERQAPGFAEALRAASLGITANAMLSRAVSGIRGATLIINFPGSPKACREAFAVVGPALGHALETLTGIGGECAR